MTKQYISIFLLQFIFLTGNAQDYRNDVCTPKGSNVVAWSISSEFTDYEKTYWDSYFASAYPNIEIIHSNGNFSTTRKFNCHGYAWHVSEDGDNRWIGYYYGNTDEYIYWQDGSYVETTRSVPVQRKVSYAADDHSAITTDRTDWFISKWGDKILCRHRYDDCPYISSNLKYYKLNRSISGPSAVCSYGASFTIENLPAVDSIIWSTGPNLTVYSGQNTNSPVIKATGSSSSWVSARLVTDCGGITLPQITVGAGEPIKDDFHFVMLNLSTGEYVSNFTNGNGNPAELCPNTVYQFWTDYSGPFTVQDLSWDLPSGWEIQAQYGSDNSFTTYFDVDDNVHTGLHLTVQTTECGWGNMLPGFYFLEDYSCGDYYLLISPNPSTSEATLSIESTSDEKAIDGDMEWELEIYGTNQTRKIKKIGLRGKSTKVNTSGWQEGVYPVRLIYRPVGKQEITLTGKLVVKP